MYKVFLTSDTIEWQNIINSFQQKDVYYHPGYLKAYKENGDGDPVLFYLENSYGRVANVFLLRDIYCDQKLMPYLSPGKFYDISTVYGYGGPVFEAKNLKMLEETYVLEFENYCRQNNIITEFIRFHPIFKNYVFLEESHIVNNIRSTICIDLSNGEDYTWSCLQSNCKRNIKKAHNEGIKIIYGRDIYLVEQFTELYISTMKKDNASKYYFFNENFFSTIINELENNSFIFAAEYQQKIIAACMIIYSDDLVHYHLAGSDNDYQKLRPNNLLIHEVAKWGCREGKKFFHLGGGVFGDDDNLYRFKKSFSTGIPLSFYVGKKVHNEAMYNKLIDIRAVNDKSFDINTKYFPKYRG